MFAYNPTVEDRSGEILGAAQASSATTKANANVKLVSDIGSSLVSLAGAYGASKMQAAGGKAFKEFMGVAGPSMGLKDEQLKMFKGMNDQDAFQMSQMFMPVAPSMVSSNSLGKYYSAAALANQRATIQNQVPANQQPVSLPPQSDAASTQGGAPSWMGLIKPRPQQQQQ
jgi:hypothetical protein